MLTNNSIRTEHVLLNQKTSHKFEREQGVYGRDWREEKEKECNKIIISIQKRKSGILF